MAFKIKEIKPLFTGVVTTAVTYKEDMTTANGLIVDTRRMAGTLNPYQRVYAVGSMVKDLKAGDIVKLNLKRYEKARHLPGAIDEAQNKQFDNVSITMEVPMVVIDDVEYLYVQNNDIEYIVTKCDIDEGGLLQ